MPHIVNRRDLSFLLNEVLGLPALLAAPRFADWDSEAVDGVLDLAEALAEEKYLPHAAAIDAQEPRFVDGKVEMLPVVAEALAAYAEAGFFAASFDAALGGMQLPYVVNLCVNGIFSAANVGISSYSFLTVGAANLIAACGNAEQKALFLPPMLAGRWFGTMCLSEPQAGSSLSDIRTRAEPLGDGRYRITGSKMWISGGDHEISENIVHMVLAKIPGGPAGVKGISLFIVPKKRVGADGSVGESNNVALAGLNHKMGHRGTTNCLLNFGENGDCIGWLVGPEHHGLAAMFHMMNEARIGVGHGSVMSALAGYLYSLDYARTRLQGRHPQEKDPESPQVPIIEHADIRRMLMMQKAAVEGAQALVTYAGMLIDRQQVSGDKDEAARLGLLLEILTPIVKSWPSEHCLEANKWAIQVLGGYGYTREYPVERLYRDNRLNHIHEGTYAIHGIDILGRKVSMAGGAALKALVAEIEGELARCTGLLDAEAATLRGALERILATTETALAHPDRNRSLANATLYLDAAGTVVVGWMWLWQARVAQAALAGGSGDAAFYEGKLAACRYFLRYELPRALTQFDLVASLDDTCLTLKPEHFTGT